MNLYAFELGRKKELCLNELSSVLGEKNLYDKNLDTAIFKLDKLENAQSLQDKLGGTIKIIEVFAHLKHPDKKEIASIVEKHLDTVFTETFKDHEGKAPFSINVLSFNNPGIINIKRLLNFSKIFLKSLGINSRFLNKDFHRNPKPSMIYKAKAVEKGIDINIINGDKELFIGKTIAIQNIDRYSIRDFEKPKRDAKVGMLPPKLAQILINLAGPNTKSIYDPFCGTGTILMEAMLAEKTALGSDIDERMTDYSEENCKWLKELAKLETSFRIFHKDARFLTKNDLPEKIDAVVTEGYLGQALSKAPNPQKQEEIFRELANLHLNWLNTINQLTPQNCPVVMCLTAYKIGKQIAYFPKFEEIAKLSGYKIVKNFLYERPDQVVVREIVLLEKISRK